MFILTHPKSAIGRSYPAFIPGWPGHHFWRVPLRASKQRLQVLFWDPFFSFYGRVKVDGGLEPVRMCPSRISLFLRVPWYLLQKLRRDPLGSMNAVSAGGGGSSKGPVGG